MSEFVNTISDATIRHPLLEKKRSLAAIGEMIKLARDQIRSALPQVGAHAPVLLYRRPLIVVYRFADVLGTR